jgi:PEGA domain
VLPRSRHLVFLTVALFGAALALPAQAGAQRRGPRVRATRSPRNVVSLGYGWYPRFGFYHPYGYQGWGPYPPYGYRVLPIDRRASLRVDATPRDAQVFVDGYSAGVVDQFDGVFQRLHLESGGHDITIYLPGFRTVTESMYLGPGEDRRLRIRLEPLGPGEVASPPPAPHEPAAPPEGAGPPGAARPPRTMPSAPLPERDPEVRPAVTAVGTLALRVQPADARIQIDGETWSASTGNDRLLIQVPEGRHRLEISKPGFQPYAEDILIQRSRTLSLNVILRSGD